MKLFFSLLLSAFFLILSPLVHATSEQPNWNVTGWLMLIPADLHGNELLIVDSDQQPVDFSAERDTIPGVWKVDVPQLYQVYSLEEFDQSGHHFAIRQKNTAAVEIVLSTITSQEEGEDSLFEFPGLSSGIHLLKLNNSSAVSASQRLMIDGQPMIPQETDKRPLDPKDLIVQSQVHKGDEPGFTFRDADGKIRDASGKVIGTWDPNAGKELTNDSENLLFPDVRSPLLRKAVLYLKASNILQGYEDGTFQPERIINRAEALKMIFSLKGITTEANRKTAFPDVPAGAWYAPFVAEAQKRNLIQGYPDGTYRPDRMVNKVEFIKISMLAQDDFISPSIHDPSLKQYSDLEAQQWYMPYVTFAVLHEFLDRTQKLHPDDGMTRGEAAMIIYRLLMSSQP